jgi:capsular polysaccharide biosynthesis protein
MEHGTLELDFSVKEILSLLFKRLPWMIICVVLCAGISLGYNFYLKTPKYKSEMVFYIDPNYDQQKTLTDDVASVNYARQIVNTYIEILKTNSFYNEVKKYSSKTYSTEELIKLINITHITDTELIKIEIITEFAEESYNLAVTVQNAAISIINRVIGMDSIKIADPPLQSDKPSNTSVVSTTVLSAVVGLVLFIIIILVIELFDTRIKSEADLRANYNMPILGSIIEFR